MQCHAQRKNEILSARYPELPDESYNDVVARARHRPPKPEPNQLTSAARRAARRAALTRNNTAV